METNKRIRENQSQKRTRNQENARDSGWTDADGVNLSARHGGQRNQTGDGEISERCGTREMERIAVALSGQSSPLSLLAADVKHG